MSKVLAVCIKSYSCEDDLDRFRNAEIDFDEIKVYKVGVKHMVVDGLYDKKYWKKEVNQED